MDVRLLINIDFPIPIFYIKCSQNDKPTDFIKLQTKKTKQATYSHRIYGKVRTFGIDLLWWLAKSLVPDSNFFTISAAEIYGVPS
jgi:hypothetical protein